MRKIRIKGLNIRVFKRNLKKVLKLKYAKLLDYDDACVNRRFGWYEKELLELKTLFDMYRSMAIQKSFDNPDVVREIRKSVLHEVCEKIRNKVNEISFWDCERHWEIIEKDEFDEILNQIERGDEDEDENKNRF